MIRPRLDTAPPRLRGALRAHRAYAVVVATLVLGACGPDSPTGLGTDTRIEPAARPAVVRGIYVNAQAAGAPGHLADLLTLADNSDLNAFVVDVKERGEVSYSSEVALVDQVGAARGYIEDVAALLRSMAEHGIYPIARIVVFRDPVLAEARPDLAIRTRDGGVWLDPENQRPWVDPHNRDVWAYNIDLAREAIAAGFAEVQWDYVRFPDVTDSVRAEMVFPGAQGQTAAEAIEAFVSASRDALTDYPVPITADVFGRVITDTGGSGIGQDFDQLVRVTDVLLPMVYPSLYWPGSFGIADPPAEPYTLVRTAMDSAVVRLGRSDSPRAIIRPWLQAFTLGNAAYGPAEMQAQIRAVEDAGLSEWLFWNPDSVYPTGVF